MDAGLFVERSSGRPTITRVSEVTNEAAVAAARLFTGRMNFDPAAAALTFRDAPARRAVCFFADADDRPVQLLCVGNLRQSLRRRLGEPSPDDATVRGRINYRELVRRVYWQRVDSALESDAVYLAAARALFPESYRGLLGFRPAFFIHIDLEVRFPRFVRTTSLQPIAGATFGPLEDKHAAARLIELLEDAFDLCRYYNILVEAPDGRACAYKEMGKCPAPCDGSISMLSYRAMIEMSIRALEDPDLAGFEQLQRMRDAACDLRFELAARIKAYSDQLRSIGEGAYSHVRRVTDFVFLSLQRGPRDDSAKVFLIVGGTMREIAGLIDEPTPEGSVLEWCAECLESASGDFTGPIAAENMSLSTHHLFAPKKMPGAFLHRDEWSIQSIRQAWRSLKKHKPAPEPDDEAVSRELNAL